MCVENALGRVAIFTKKARFQTLHCFERFVVLHNICELYGDVCPEEWLESKCCNNNRIEMTLCITCHSLCLN